MDTHHSKPGFESTQDETRMPAEAVWRGVVLGERMELGGLGNFLAGGELNEEGLHEAGEAGAATITKAPGPRAG